MKNIDGKIVKRFMAREKMVVILELENNDKAMYLFRITDKCNKLDYYSNERYDTQIACERASMKVCKGC